MPPSPSPPPPTRSLVQRWVDLHRNEITLVGLILSFIVIFFWKSIFIPIFPGQQGVYWSRFFGGTVDWVITEGTFLKLPWDTITIYDVREHAIRDETVLLTTDGLNLNVHWYIRYRPQAARLPELHSTVGPDYAERLIIPEVVSSLRQVIGNYRADEIYAQDEAGLLAQISGDVVNRLSEAPVELLSVQIMELTLPPLMEQAIVQKLIEQQTFQSYEFRVQAEQAEANRKIIEAGGLSRFHEISGIDPLKWRGIAATIELAKSQNTKIVLMGTDAGQLPIILNTEPNSPLPATLPASPQTSPQTALPSPVPPVAPSSSAAPASAPTPPPTSRGNGAAPPPPRPQ